ncbi:MAG: RnfABCDGE type electron transport complex subunit C [Candidatus Bipolaricaulia bacterium]
MPLETLKTFKGGHYFDLYEGTPRFERLERLPPPDRVTVFLKPGVGEAVKPQVEVGDRVKTGQIIGRDDEVVSTPIHASISGEVVEIEERPHPLGGEATAVVIESDGEDSWETLAEAGGAFERKSQEELGELLYLGGVTDIGRTGFPTPFNSAQTEPGNVKYLVINAVETEPYLEAEDQLIYEEFEKFFTGIRIMRTALGNVEVHVGIGYNKPRIIEELETRIQHLDWFYIHPLRPKYPQGEDDVLLRTLLDLYVPTEPTRGYTTDVGAVVVDVQYLVAAYDAVILGRPFVERTTSISGSALQHTGNFWVRVGTPLKALLSDRLIEEQVGVILLGGPIRGHAQESLEAPVLKNTQAVTVLKRPTRELLAFVKPGFDRSSYTGVFPPVPGGDKAKQADVGLHGEPRECVRCGYCFDVCPVDISPIFLARYAQHEMFDRAQDLNIFACIDCGLCSYVCPSKIPLAALIKEGKEKLERQMMEGQ